MRHQEKNPVTKATVDLEEQNLLDKLVLGNRSAFWQLWSLHRDYLYRRCLSWMEGNRFDAEEAMSLASLKAWHKLPAHAHRITNFKGWLIRLVHNLCIDIHRQRSRGAIGTENVDNLSLGNQLSINSNADSPESSLLQQEQKIYLRYCIENLPSRLRQPVIMFYFQELTYADIATNLLISQNNLAKRLQEARQILKRKMKQYYSGGDESKIDESQAQILEQQDLSASINLDLNIEKIDYRITISCLETLSPVWCSFHQTQEQVSVPI